MFGFFGEIFNGIVNYIFTTMSHVRIGQGGRFVGQEAVQIHGGMGMTDELAVGHYFKRLTMIDSEFGNVDFHMRRYSRLSGEDQAMAAE